MRTDDVDLYVKPIAARSSKSFCQTLAGFGLCDQLVVLKYDYIALCKCIYMYKYHTNPSFLCPI